MKTRLLLVVLASAFASLAGFAADAPKTGDKKGPPQKSPADLAYDDFAKLLNERAKLAQPHFKTMIKSGIDFLMKNPTHNRAAEVVRQLSEYSGNVLMRDKATQGQVPVYVATLKYDVLDARIMAESDPQKAAIAALDAGAADADMRFASSGPNQELLREKIDALAALPGSDRFLVDREKSYYSVLTAVKGPKAAGAHLQSLATSKDKKVADMAKQELSLLEMMNAPFDLKFTGLDGKETDFAQLRGKVVAMFFWSSTNGNSTRLWDGMKLVASDYRKKGLEVVTVSFDKAEDREKVLAYVKENGVKFPVHYDGKGNKADFAAKIGVTSVPRIVLFDQKGMLKYANVQPQQLEPAVKQLLGIK
jgi:cytochrome oxidase Cu insertion factor (SCO1/SenC/PrrC family)